MDIFTLSEEIRRCTACPLWKGRTLAVPGEGPKNAKIIVIGEAPGAEEDHQGVPFVGRSGKFLDSLFTKINLNRKNIFITSVVKCHPPQNRTPNSTEINTCQELWLHKQITLINPQIIILLGSTAVKATFKTNILSKQHGTIVKKNNNNYFITYHPSAAMRFPKINQLMTQDFLKLKKIILKEKVFK